MDKVLMIPYLMGMLSLVVSMSFLLRQEHLNQSISQLWWPLRFPLGVILIEKTLLNEKGITLHGKVVYFAWWFVRLILLGLLVNLTYVFFFR